MEAVTPTVELQLLIHLECQKSIKYIFQNIVFILYSDCQYESSNWV